LNIRFILWNSIHIYNGYYAYVDFGIILVDVIDCDLLQSDYLYGFCKFEDVFQMCNLFLWLFVNIMLLIGKLGPTLWHTFGIGTCMCLTVDGDLVVPLEICSKEGSFHYDFIATVKVCHG